MLVKVVLLFLLAMVVIGWIGAKIGRLRLPFSRPRPLSGTCPACGRPRIGRGPCPCGHRA